MATLAGIINEGLGRDVGPITEETRLEDIGVNSLELVEILMTIEDRYDLSIELDAVEAREKLQSVGDLIALGKAHGIV